MLNLLLIQFHMYLMHLVLRQPIFDQNYEVALTNGMIRFAKSANVRMLARFKQL